MPPYTPELNAIYERINRTLEEAASSLLIQAKLPGCLCPFALKHVIYVRNRVQHSTIGTTPFSMVKGTPKSETHTHIWMYRKRLPRLSKFEPRAVEGMYLETLEHGVYKVLVSDNNGVYRIIQSQHVTFDESKFLGAEQLNDIMKDEVSDDDDAGVSNYSEETSSVESSISSGTTLNLIVTMVRIY